MNTDDTNSKFKSELPISTSSAADSSSSLQTSNEADASDTDTEKINENTQAATSKDNQESNPKKREEGEPKKPATAYQRWKAVQPDELRKNGRAVRARWKVTSVGDRAAYINAYNQVRNAKVSFLVWRLLPKTNLDEAMEGYLQEHDSEVRVIQCLIRNKTLHQASCLLCAGVSTLCTRI
jgi:hypothetical protein